MCEEQGRSEPLAAAIQTQSVQTSPEDLERIFREHHAGVFRAAYRVTGNASDAEDVLQTVFLRLLRREGDAQAIENMGSFLHRAAVNAGLDLLRARQTARSIPLDDVAPLLPESPALSPDRSHAAGEIRVWLRKAVARLGPRAGEMFALRFFEGKSNAEIAASLGTTQATVAVTLSRTRDRIEQEYRSQMGEQQ
jgi:RNA polymerase sigma-70 factor (ECF subfamily)